MDPLEQKYRPEVVCTVTGWGIVGMTNRRNRYGLFDYRKQGVSNHKRVYYSFVDLCQARAAVNLERLGLTPNDAVKCSFYLRTAFTALAEGKPWSTYVFICNGTVESGVKQTLTWAKDRDTLEFVFFGDSALKAQNARLQPF